MVLSDFLARFYSKVFIGMYEDGETLHIGVALLSRRGTVQQMLHTFEKGMSDDTVTFLQGLVSQTPYNYIALLTDAGSCGALPTCSLSKAKEMAPAVGMSKTVCIDEEWLNYCAEEDLHALEHRYHAVRPDAVYSPFALLHAHYEEAMAGAHAVYISLTPGAMSLAVVKERHLRFAEHFACEAESIVAVMIERIVNALEAYYGKPCCRGEFIESVYVLDGTGAGEMLSKALEELLLVESELQEVDAALLCARTLMKENGYVL